MKRTNETERHSTRLAAQLYARAKLEEILAELPLVGEQLDTGFRRLAKFNSLENCDSLLARLQTAQVSVQRLRQRLAEEVVR